MRKPLFRQQAIDHKKNRLHGQVLVLPSLWHTGLALLLLLWVTCVIVWLLHNQYARKASAAGWLQPSEGIIKIFPKSTDGIVKSILVTEGQQVSIGQALMVINGDRYLTHGSSLEQEILSDLEQQKQQVSLQMDRLMAVSQTQMTQIQAQKLASEQDLLSVDTQLDTLAQRKMLLSRRLQRYQKIHRQGHVSQLDVEQVEEQLLSVISSQQSIQRDKNRQQTLIDQLNVEISILPKQRDNQIAELTTRLSDIRQDILLLQGQRNHVIRATKAGTITNLQAISGQAVGKDKPLMSIVPVSSQVLAKLLIPVRAAGFITQGQHIDIRYDAFPYQKFGLYQGKVTSVSSAIVLPGELKDSPISVSEPVYLVTASLMQQTINAFDQSMPLKAGMTFTADITLAHRSLLEWLLDPLFSLRGTI